MASIQEIIDCVVNDKESNDGISSIKLQDDILLYHPMYIESIDLFNIILNACQDHEISMKAKLRAIKMIETWANKYWIDFTLNDKIINNMKVLANSQKDCFLFYEHLYSMTNNHENVYENIKYIIKAYTICHFLSLHPNKYIPTEIIQMMANNMDMAEILLFKLTHKCIHKLEQVTNDMYNKEEETKSIENDIKNDSFDVCEFDAKLIAQQITLMDFAIVNEIKKRELINQNWTGLHKTRKAPNIRKMIDRFDDIYEWIQTTILSKDTPKKRGQYIKQFVNISHILLSHRNYQSAVAFFSALDSYGTGIHRLSKSWSYVPRKCQQKHNELKNAWRHLRGLHRTAISPKIPCCNLLLIDIASIDRGNRNWNDNERTILNMDKLQRMSEQLDIFDAIQKQKPYEFAVDVAMQDLLIKRFAASARNKK